MCDSVMSLNKLYVRVVVQGGKVVLNPQVVEVIKSSGFDPDEVSRKVLDRVGPLLQLGFRTINVEIDLVPGRYYEINPMLPSITEMLLKCVGRDEGPHSTQEKVGDLDIVKIAEIAYYKFPELKSKGFRKALKQVLSAAATIGITVNGRNPEEVIRELDGGSYDDVINRFEERLREEGLL